MQASAAEQTLIMSMFVQAVIHTMLKGTHASGYHFWHKYRFLYLYHLPSVQWILHSKSVINAPLSPIRFACRVTSVPITGAWECKWGWSPGSHTCASWARRLPLRRPCFQVCKEVWGEKNHAFSNSRNSLQTGCHKSSRSGVRALRVQK